MNFSFYRILGFLFALLYLPSLNALNSQAYDRAKREVAETLVVTKEPPPPPPAPGAVTPPSKPTPPVVAPKPAPPPAPIPSNNGQQNRIPPPPIPPSYVPPSDNGQQERIPPPPIPGAPVVPPVVAKPVPGKHTAPASPTSPAPTSAPSREVLPAPEGPSQGQQDQKRDAVVKLAQRVADLFACVPSHKDTLYSTQSWFVVDTFMAWNNAAAESVFGSGADASQIKETFETAALEQLKMRNPELLNDPNVVNYVKNAGLSAENIFKNATEKKQSLTSFSEASALVKSSSRINGKNIFQNLKPAYDAHAPALKANTCAGLGKSFFGSPKFAIPSTQASKSAVKKEPVVHKISDRPAALVKALAEQDAKDARDAAIEKKYPVGESINTQLPPVKFEDRNKAGYYSHVQSDLQFARPHIVGNILKAADTLKGKGLAMGVAVINQNGGTAKKATTFGYNSHKEGTRATLMLMDAKGNAATCDDPSCYDKEKNFQMLAALVDADPDNIQKIEVNDKEIQERLVEHMMLNHKYKRISANWIVRSNKEFKNTINFEWRD